MKKKLSFTIALTLCLTMLLSACSGGGTQPTTSPAGTDEGTQNTGTPEATDSGTISTKDLVIQLGPSPETIDPALNSSVDGANYLYFTFEGLLRNAEDGTVQPGQAESWEVSEDGLSYTFHLREGLMWSDGSPITANDFVYSWRRVADPLTAAPYGSTVLSMVEGFDAVTAGNTEALAVSAPDDLTFVVKLSWNCPYFDRLCAFPALFPVQQATIETNGEAWATAPETYVTNGAWAISEFVVNSHILFVPNPNYHSPELVKLSSIKCLLIENDAASLATFQTGESQMIKAIPAAEIAALRTTPEYRIEPLLGTYYLDVNNTREPFTDPRVRMALSLAIDRKYVADTLMQGTYLPAPNFVGPGIADHDGTDFYSNANGGVPYIDIEAHEANVEKAKQLLADAGYPNGEGLPAFVYSFNDTLFHKVVAEYLQQAWADIGVTMTLSVVEWPSFTPLRRAGDYDSARDGWLCDYNDPSNLLELAETGNGNNNCKFSSAEYDAAMAESRTAATREERWAALHRAEDIVMAEAGLIPVAYYAQSFLINETITDWWFSPDGAWHFEFADLAA